MSEKIREFGILIYMHMHSHHGSSEKTYSIHRQMEAHGVYPALYFK